MTMLQFKCHFPFSWCTFEYAKHRPAAFARSSPVRPGHTAAGRGSKVPQLCFYSWIFVQASECSCSFHRCRGVHPNTCSIDLNAKKQPSSRSRIKIPTKTPTPPNNREYFWHGRSPAHMWTVLLVSWKQRVLGQHQTHLETRNLRAHLPSLIELHVMISDASRAF